MRDDRGEKLCNISEVPLLRETFLETQHLLDIARAEYEAAKKKVDAAHNHKWGRVFDILVNEGILPDGAGTSTWSLQWGNPSDGDPFDSNAATVLYGRRKTNDDAKHDDDPGKMIDDAIRKIAFGGVSQ